MTESPAPSPAQLALAGSGVRAIAFGACGPLRRAALQQFVLWLASLLFVVAFVLLLRPMVRETSGHGTP